jgi:arginine decarboxylase
LNVQVFFLVNGGRKNLDQTRAPIFDALKEHVARKWINFHVPGHKQGQMFDREALEWFHPLLSMDLTEVGQLDDLHQPTGVIKEAQQLAAEAFRATTTYFLVGGTTAGNLAAILACCPSGGSVIVQRSSHQSVFHGCMLAGAKPVYLKTGFDECGVEKPVSPQEIERILKEDDSVKAVVLTSPSYYGRVQPVREIAQVCHRHRVLLIVDEAHGAHFGFHKALPQSAMDLGADIAVQSTHKMLPSMTMSSMLHLQGQRVSPDEVRHWLRVIESSSPSYPLMASLDVTRRLMATEGERLLNRLLTDLEYFRGNIQSLQSLSELKADDPLKFTLTANGKITGFQLADRLKQEGIHAELADPLSVLLVLGLGTTREDLKILWKALKKIDQSLAGIPASSAKVSFAFATDTQKVRLPLSELRRRSFRAVPLSEAAGKVAVEMVVPYPPGIPVVLPGETWTREAQETIETILKGGGQVRGVSQHFNPTVNVLT